MIELFDSYILMLCRNYLNRPCSSKFHYLKYSKFYRSCSSQLTLDFHFTSRIIHTLPFVLNSPGNLTSLWISRNIWSCSYVPLCSWKIKKAESKLSSLRESSLSMKSLSSDYIYFYNRSSLIRLRKQSERKFLRFRNTLLFDLSSWFFSVDCLRS